MQTQLNLLIPFGLVETGLASIPMATNHPKSSPSTEDTSVNSNSTAAEAFGPFEYSHSSAQPTGTTRAKSMNPR